MRTPLLFLAALLALHAQAQDGPGRQETVFKVETTVRQVDAVVTDRNGRVVEGLTAADFEIEGKRAAGPVDYCSFIPLTGSRGAPAPGDRRLLREELRRTFVFVISSPLIHPPQQAPAELSARLLGAAVAGVRDAADMIAHFVGNRMQDGDLVEVLRVDHDLGVLAQPTNDRKALLDAVGKLRAAPLPPNSRPVEVRSMGGGGRLDLQDVMHQNLRAVRLTRAAVDRLAGLPGRKVVILAAKFMLPNHPLIEEGRTVAQAVAELTEEANRAGVTIHTVALSALARDDGPFGASDHLARIAGETGGTLAENTNDFHGAIDRIAELNRGYYLLGYRVPDSASPAEKIKVRVKRAGLKIHARTAALSLEPQAASGRPLEDGEIGAALFSPLALRDVPVTLEADPVIPAGNAARLSCRLNIDIAKVELGAYDEEHRGFELYIAIGVAGPDGTWRQIASNVHTYRIAKGRETSLPGLLTRKYDIGLEKPGHYQVRALVRDQRSRRAGTAAVFVTAPAAPKRAGAARRDRP